MGKVIGIDLGTTYSAVAYLNKYGQVEIIPNREGERTTPSVVMFDEETPIVGSIAKRSAVANSDYIIQFIKRQMGDSSWEFITDEDETYKPEEISAIILKRLKEDAATFLGEEVKDAVITVPAYFNDAQRKATQDAGNIAGLNVLRIINEPTAAAIAYGLDKGEKNQTILVYDLGGGTFDVTIIKITKDSIDVIATDGDKNLGGFDWDNEIIKFLSQEFQKQGGSDLSLDPTLLQDLREKAETAKKTLSTKSKTKVFLFANGKNASIELTLEKFQEITENLLERTADLMQAVLEDAKLQWKDIDKTLLVGGSTKMKAVADLVEKVTGKKPSREVHPDEAVAMGAALQGALLQMKQGNMDLVELEEDPSAMIANTALKELSKVEIKDVNSHSLGVICLDSKMWDMGIEKEINSIVLGKNTPIPCKASNTYYTIQDNQKQLSVRISEGEDVDPQYVTIIGKTLLNLTPRPKGSPLEHSFEYDENGIVHVKVYDTSVKSKKFLGELKIQRESNMNEEEVKKSNQKVTDLVIG
jgi:molecular chaperone DnaK